MSTPADGTPDVVALDTAGGVIYAWQGTPGIESIDELPTPNRLAHIAIEDAAVIRRRDGKILKDTTGQYGDPSDLLDDDEIEEGGFTVAPGEQAVELHRVELIDEPEELAEHEPLDEARMALVGLWAAVASFEDGAIYVTDREILKATQPGANLTFERREDGFIVRAHVSEISVIDLGEALDD